jgi:hypothetical protein
MVKKERVGKKGRRPCSCTLHGFPRNTPEKGMREFMREYWISVI